jgi:hypothetical protein
MSHLNNVRQEHKLISHLPKSLSPRHRPLRPITAAAKLQRFIASDIIMKFVIISGAINIVIKTMCVCHYE